MRQGIPKVLVGFVALLSLTTACSQGDADQSTAVRDSKTLQSICESFELTMGVAEIGGSCHISTVHRRVELTLDILEPNADQAATGCAQFASTVMQERTLSGGWDFAMLTPDSSIPYVECDLSNAANPSR